MPRTFHLPKLLPHQAILHDSEWLSSRSREFRAAFLELGTIIELAPGKHLYRRGRVTQNAYGLIRGQLDVVMYAPNGIQIVSPTTTPGRWLSFSDMITRTPPIADAVVRIPSLVLGISRRELVRFLDEKPSRYRELMTYDNASRHVLQQAFTCAITTSGEARVAALLLGLFEGSWLRANKAIQISQQEIAVLTGSSIATIQRVFRRLKADGALETRYGQFVLTDVDRLRGFAAKAKQKTE